MAYDLVQGKSVAAPPVKDDDGVGVRGQFGGMHAVLSVGLGWGARSDEILQ